MITVAQAKEWVDAKLGVATPSFEIAAACEAVESREPLMVAAEYGDWTQQRIQCLAVALMVSNGARVINSQSAPSGASRSFKNRDDALTAMRRELAALDPAATVADVVGPDPVTGTLLLVV